MSGEIEARVDLVKRLDAAQASIPAKNKAVEIAISAIRSLPKDAPPADYVKASGELSTAQRGLEGAQGDADKLARGIKALDILVAFQEKVGPCNEYVNKLHPAMPDDKARAMFAAAGVTGYTITVAHIAGETLVSHKFVGENVPQVPGRTARVKGESTGNGRGRFVNVTPAGNLNDRDYVAQFGPGTIGDEKTEHALTAPGGTLYVTARSLNKKLGHDRIEA